MSAMMQLKNDLVQLPQDDRAELAAFLIESLDDATDENAGQLWDHELARRAAEIENGTAAGELADVVMQRLQERYQ